MRSRDLRGKGTPLVGPISPTWRGVRAPISNRHQWEAGAIGQIFSCPFQKHLKKKKCKTALINSIYVDFSLNKNSSTECKFYKSYVQKNFILKEG